MTVRVCARRQRNPVGGKELHQIALEGLYRPGEAFISCNSGGGSLPLSTRSRERERLSHERENPDRLGGLDLDRLDGPDHMDRLGGLDCSRPAGFSEQVHGGAVWRNRAPP